MPFYRQMRQKRLNLCAPYFCRMPFSMEQDETTYPLDILLLGPYAVMQKLQALPKLRQKFWRVIPVRVRHKTCNLLKIN